MQNLYEELMCELKDANKTINDIDFVSCNNEEIIIENFLETIKDINYCSGFGTNEISLSLYIIFKDKTWLSRGEYDGSEWFEYNKCPERPMLKTNVSIKESILRN